MKGFLKKTTAAVGALAITASSVPFAVYSDVHAADDALMTRDIWFADADVNRWESEHFQFIWGKNGADSAKITTAFLEENAKNLEACWDIYMNDLSMEPPTQSVNMALRDGNKYKVNFYISGTGLQRFADDWAYMGYDDQGYAFMFCCVGAMQNSPNPSWVLPHEFGHVVTAHQLGWNDNKYVSSWWEAIANWYREQFLYSDYYSQWANVNGITDFFETYMKNLCFTPIFGRDNYASWAFLQYLTENPDGLKGYGSDFVKELMQQGKRNEYPYEEIERISGEDIKDTLGHYAKRLATLDLAHKKDYTARLNELTQYHPWNWGEIYTVLDRSTADENYYTVPTERAPQQFGLNIIPLKAEKGEVKASLEGLTNVAGADWRACLVVESKDKVTRYSSLFKAGETASIDYSPESDSAAYLVVTATPDKEVWQKIGVPWAYGEGEFDENNYPHLSKTRYPYGVKLENASTLESPDFAAGIKGHAHPNGGGFVAETAKVDATAYVGSNASVLGYATVKGNARIDGYAVVTDNAAVSDNAVVNGHAVVAERASVKDNAIISDFAGVMGNAVISGNARVIESGLVFNDYKVSENATVKGVAYCLAKGSASGQAMPDGDYYDDSGRSITGGSVFGWASPDKYVNSRKFNDGQCAALEFDTDSSTIAPDSYTTTYGTVMGAPTWSEKKTGANGVLTFSGDSQYIIGDSSYAALHEAEYQTAVLLRDSKRSDIFSFGSDRKYTLTAENGNISLNCTNGEDSQKVEAENAYSAGEWVTVSVYINGGNAVLTTNNGSDTIKAEGKISLSPVNTMSEDSIYSIGGFNGSMDYFKVFSKDVAEPEYYYTEKEEIADIPEMPNDKNDIVWGDSNCDGEVSLADAVMIMQSIANPSKYGIEGNDENHITSQGQKNGDVSENGNGITNKDALAIQKYCLELIKELPEK